MNLLDLTGKKALVVGAGGIGAAVAAGLAEHGADVAVADKDLESAASAAARVRSLGRQASAHTVEVTDETVGRRVGSGPARFLG